MHMRRTKQAIREMYGLSEETINRRISWIKKHSERYPKDSVTRNGRLVFVRLDVFDDMILNMNHIDAGIPVEPFRGERL